MRLIHPRFWPTWILLGIAFVVTASSAVWRQRIAALAGRYSGILFPRRTHIARTNLQLCFPDQTEQALKQQLNDTMTSTAEGLLETGLAWLHPKRLKHLETEFEGLSHLERQPGDPGILIIGMHFATLDLAGALLSAQHPFHVMYKRNQNPVIEWVMRTGRAHHYPAAIDHTNIRRVIRALDRGAAVWYAPDQDYGPQNAVFAPFFGHPAATTTAANRIARITGAKVVFLSHYRLNTGRYRIVIEPPSAPFPSKDDVQDSTLINRHIEGAIRQAPEQYWWVHRRFKSAVDGRSNRYEQVEP